MRRRLAALALAALLPLPALAAEVVVQSGETLSDIATRHGVSVNRLMQLNGIKDPNLVHAGSRLVLPAGSRVSRSDSGGAGRGGSQAQSHVVRPGETLSEIADRHGLSTSRLMQLNGIQDPNLVVVGTRLVLRAGRSGSGRSSGAPKGPTTRHTVGEGETLSEIADRYGLSTSRLMQLNGIQDPNRLFAGSQLVVPAPQTAPRPAAATAPPRPSYNRQASEHVVRPGETLSDIAEGYKVPLDRLIALNGLKDPDTLISGSRLKLRAPATVTAKATAAKPTAAKPSAAKPTPPQPNTAQATTPKPSSAKPARAAAPTPAAPPATAQAPAARLNPAPTATTAPTPPTPAAAQPSSASAATTVPATTATGTPVPATSGAASPTAPASTTAIAPPARPALSPAAQRQSPEPAPSRTEGNFTPATAPQHTTAANTTPSRPSPASTSTTPVITATRQPSPAPARPTSTTSTTSPTTKAATPDWRTYGPLQIDWANWHPMGGSFVAPSLNRDGQPLYLAVNCKARKINATSQAGQWNTWDAPQSDFEVQLVNDICRQRGG